MIDDKNVLAEINGLNDCEHEEKESRARRSISIPLPSVSLRSLESLVLLLLVVVGGLQTIELFELKRVMASADLTAESVQTNVSSGSSSSGSSLPTMVGGC